MIELTTEALKIFISISMCSSEIEKDIFGQFCYSKRNFQSQLEQYHCEDCKTPEEFCQKLWGLLKDPNQWKENEKFILNKEWDSHFSFKNNKFDYDYLDVSGTVNRSLLNKLNTVEQLQKCIYREFNHTGVFIDTYSIVIITTPEDEEVVVWNLCRD